MMRRAIYTEAHTQLWLDTATTLRDQLGLEPCYWVGKPHFGPRVAERFPDAVFHSRTDAIRGVPSEAFAGMPLRPLDADILSRFSYALLMAGKMMDRLDVREGFRYEERTRLFMVQLRYWRGVIERIEPDIVLFPVQPHTVYDYILYELCQAYGIRTCMFQWTAFHDWLYPLDHIDRGYTEIQERYQRWLSSGVGDVPLAPALEQYLLTVSGDYRRAIPDYLVEQMPAELHAAIFGGHTSSGDVGLLGAQMPEGSPAPPARRPATTSNPPANLWLTDRTKARKYLARHVELQMQRQRRIWRHAQADVARGLRRAGTRVRLGAWRIVGLPSRAVKAVRRVYRRYLKMAVRAVAAGDMNRPLKEPGRSMSRSFRGRWGGARLQFYRLAGASKKRQLLREYLNRCGELDLQAPYVFVALHYQPEQTTAPTGSVFVDQGVMIDMLARLVPSGWRVYVKEHPFQFFPTSIGERSRSREFYDDLLEHPNVTLVPWWVSPFELIDHARAVATVTGTTGIEAVLRGRPVFVFGYAWYRDCEGVFYTPDVASLREAIGRIEAGCAVDRRKVRLYLKAVEESCIRADLDFGVHIEPVPHEENVARIAGGIRRVIERQAGSACLSAAHG